MPGSDDDDAERRRVYYQSTYGGWTDQTPGMLATGARLHLALGDAVIPPDSVAPGRLTHASFFSGAGGLDLGLERAGWTTVSVSEIEPYACEVLRARWPDVPNLGNIVELVEGIQRGGDDGGNGRRLGRGKPQRARAGSDDWQRAVLWSGGFPCQDLSVAGKRRGFGGERSVLAFAFLDLVARYRPPAVLLENVPGLLSSHRGRDMATLFGRLVDLGYGVAYRVLNASLFGVPQRRHRVFIVGLRGDELDADLDTAAERAAEILAVGAFCERHPPTGSEEGKAATRSARSGAGIHGSAADGAAATRTLGANTGHHGYALGTQDLDGGYLQVVPTLSSGSQQGGFRTEPGSHLVVGDGRPDAATVTAKWAHGAGGPAGDEHWHLVYPDAADDARGEGGWREGAAAQGRRESRPGSDADADAARAGAEGQAADAARMREADGLAGRLDDSAGLVEPRTFVKVHHAEDASDAETWQGDDIAPTLSVDATIEARVTTLVASAATAEDPLLPKGLDSHRYRCCGNGVVTPVAEWLGRRLVEWAIEEGY